LLIETPKGGWGWLGGNTSALEIGRAIGTDKDPERWSELRQNTSKVQTSRPF